MDPVYISFLLCQIEAAGTPLEQRCPSQYDAAGTPPQGAHLRVWQRTIHLRQGAHLSRREHAALQVLTASDVLDYSAVNLQPPYF